jgi:4-hydroxybenzoate polyprenyltransferase
VRLGGGKIALVASTRASSPAAGLALVPALLGLVRFKHTVFALPFAFAGALLARLEVPSALRIWWILLAMVGARSLAMALNRLIDARIDALNPRTAARELPTGRLLPRQVIVFCAASLALLLVAVSQLPRPTWYLWPIPVAAFIAYPYTKRVTWACHLLLGLTIGLAPVGAWLAVTGGVTAAPILLGLAVATWIAGFDVIYALLDVDFDRAHGIRSIPARFGAARALWFTRTLHLAAVGLLAGAGAAAGAGAVYFLGVAACAAVLTWENAIVAPGDPGRVQAAFGTANGVLSLLFLAFVLAEVALP